MLWKDRFPKDKIYFDSKFEILYNGDCIEVLKMFPDCCIDLVVTSPPYNIGIEYDNWNDRMKWDEYFEWCKDWLRKLYRVLKDDGRLCLNHYLSFGSGKRGLDIGKKKGNIQINEDEENGRVSPLMDLNYISKEIGFKHHSVAIWQDITLSRKTAWGSWLSASSPYINCPFEGILILYKKYWKKQTKGKSTINKQDFVKLTRGIWKIGTQSKQYTKANFPLALPLHCINLLSYENDIVLDPFVGSGTTLLASNLSNRFGIGIEISKNYCQVIKKRLKENTSNIKEMF